MTTSSSSRPGTPRTRRAEIAFAALFLTACGGATGPNASRSFDRSTDAANTEQPSRVTPRLGPVSSIPEAWPEPTAGDADRLVDGDTSSVQYEVDASLRLPWTMVLRVLDAPARVAALGLHAPDAARAVTDLSVFSYLGAVPLHRANYPQFLEGSVRLGLARVDARSGWTVLRFEEPVSAHYIWFRVSGDASGTGVALSEVRLFSAEELAVLEQQSAEQLRITTLRPVDTTPYEGVNLLGLQSLGANTNPLTETGGTAEESLEGSSATAPADGAADGSGATPTAVEP